MVRVLILFYIQPNSDEAITTKFAHIAVCVLSWHVQNLVMIWMQLITT